MFHERERWVLSSFLLQVPSINQLKQQTAFPVVLNQDPWAPNSSAAAASATSSATTNQVSICLIRDLKEVLARKFGLFSLSFAISTDSSCLSSGPVSFTCNNDVRMCLCFKSDSRPVEGVLEDDVFLDCNLMNGNGDVDNENDNFDLWPLDEPVQAEDANNNFNNDRSLSVTNRDNTGAADEVPISSDDFLFDPNFIEKVDNARFLKTTHVTGHGISCEVVSEDDYNRDVKNSNSFRPVQS